MALADPSLKMLWGATNATNQPAAAAYNRSIIMILLAATSWSARD
jgi:hypothetical protein